MRRPLVLAALVIVPLLAVVGVALVGSSDGSESADTTTTVPGTPDGKGGGVGEATTAPAEGATTAPADDAATPAGGDESSASAAAEDETTVPATTEIPSSPDVAGIEGDRPVTTYPQPTVPDGGCPSRSGTVVITLDARPSPGCVSVGADQTIEFANRTGREISLVAESINEVVPAGGSFSVGADAFPTGYSTFWSPGHPDLSGLVQLR